MSVLGICLVVCAVACERSAAPKASVVAECRSIRLQAEGPRIRGAGMEEVGGVRRELIARNASLEGSVRPATLCHILLLGGSNVSIGVEGARAVDVLCEDVVSRKWFGDRIQIVTRYGLRFRGRHGAINRGRRVYESHPYQCLATLGQVGVASTYPVTVEGRRYAIADHVSDLLANFTGAEEELEWGAVALLHYVRGDRAWVNKHGDEWNFDVLARALLASGMENKNCGGTHMFGAMAMLLHVQEQDSVLSGQMARALRRRVEAFVAETSRAQEVGGAWSRWGSGDWGSGELDALVLTSHLTESFLYLPADMQPDRGVLNRACLWLWARVRKASPQEQERLLCPLTHALRAIDVLSG